MFKLANIIGFCSFIIILHVCRGSKFNVSVTDLSSCKEYRLQSTYEYKHFFLIENLKNNPKAGEILHLKFYVMTTKDAHILLSEIDNPKKNDSVYEIVIGAGGNTFSTLRRKIGTTRLSFNSLPHILTAIDPTPIEVCQYTDGKLDIIIPGMPEPHLTYEDKSPLSVKYVSFSTFGNTPARWFYDCQSEGNQITREERALTTLERLEQKLFENYSYYSFLERRDMKILFKIKGVKYNEQESIMKTRLELELRWEDKKLQWHPEKFGNLTAIYTSGLSTVRFAWRPNIIIKNGADYSYHAFNPTCLGLIFANGTINVKCMQKTIETWCITQAYSWPYDSLQCDIVLSIDGSSIKLIQDSRTIISNQPHILEISQFHLTGIVSGLNKSEVPTLYNITAPNTDLFIRLKLTRNKLFYQKVFLSPFLVVCLMILLSFCTTGLVRGAINLVSILITTLTLLLLVRSTPVTYVPNLVHLYEFAIIISCFTYFLHIQTEIFLAFPPPSQPPRWISIIINSAPLRICLGVQFINSPYYSGFQKYPWQILWRIINRLCFVALTVVFLCLLV